MNKLAPYKLSFFSYYMKFCAIDCLILIFFSLKKYNYT